MTSEWNVAVFLWRISLALAVETSERDNQFGARLARSDDLGQTFTCNTTGVPDTAVDRQWYALDGDPVTGDGSLYLTNDEVGNGAVQ